ncbi:MAG: acetate--CoA ligase family protein, partial [Proteobacteria bacterium]|nr:acetate--CoA ligase family protein [Pseudomonadota bacterium]
LYLEGFTDGRRFMEIASTSQKPILVQKSNRFRASSQIAHSHTAALFADDQLVDHVLEQAGCVRVNTLDDAVAFIKSLTLPPLKGNRLAVVSRSGGHAVIATDACAHYGFELPRFPEEILRKVESRLRAHVIRLQNPLDLGDLFDLDFYEYIVEEILKMDYVDGLLLAHGYRRGLEQAASRILVGKVANLVDRYQKPVALVIISESGEIDYLKKNFKIPIFTAPENAMRAFHLSYQRASRSLSPLKVQSLKGIDRDRAGEILAHAEGRTFLFLDEATDLLRSYGFSLPPQGLAGSQEEALEFRQKLKGPVAMKINRPHLSHKSDSGAVRLHLDSEEQVIAAFHDLRAIGGEETEVLLQAMVDRGRELILGGKQDQIFGPVILFGLGGIFVEVFEDIIWRAAPIDQDVALQMIQSVKAVKILQGLRGEKPSDIKAVADLLVRLSQLLVDFPVIQEIDINPVMAFPEGAQAVDARVILDGQTKQS